MRKTKIVCTIGPATESKEMLVKMIEAGMNVARFNFSHAVHEHSKEIMANVREASKETNKPVAIMLDTKGPEIRCGMFMDGKVFYEANDEVVVTAYECVGTKEKFYVNNKELFVDVKVGNTLLIDDGKIKVEVIKTNGVDEFVIRFINGGGISNKKGINAPDVKLTMPYLSKQDIDDITFGCSQNVDLIAMSFVRRKEDVLLVKELVEKTNNHAHIDLMAKIECKEAIENLDEILEVVDSVMVARGDLGVELPIELVPNYQKLIIEKANKLGKPVVTATHMLESMINNPIPTRAEASDVANAIYDGTDAVMLSGESTIGKYPVEAVKYMVKIANEVEKVDIYANKKKKFSVEYFGTRATLNDAIGICACESAASLDNVSAILAFTETGGTALRIAKFRPDVPIIACTIKEETTRRLQVAKDVYATTSNYIDNNILNWDKEAQAIAKKFNLPSGSKIILTSGVGMDHGQTNTIRILYVD